MHASSFAEPADRCPACGRAGPPTAPAVARCPCGAGVFVPPDGDDFAGRLLGELAVGRRMGAGATARVYAALDGERAVALKVLRPDATTRLRRRFNREAHALRALRGPHTAGLLAFGEADDRLGRPRLWLAQPHVPGATLRARLTAGPLTEPALLALADGVLRALAEAHGAGIVHRDLKPAHVVLTPAGRAVVLDFGLARLDGDERPALDALTTTGAVLGTPHYMAPEQIDHRRPVGPAADLYAAAVLLYEACAGRRPFEGLDPLLVMRAQLDAPPPPLPRRAPLRRRWSAALLRALAKDPAARFQSAAAMRRALTTAPPRRSLFGLR